MMTRYRLDDLGWLQFQQLCQSLLKANFGAAIEARGGYSDRGQDAYFHGEIEITKGKVVSGVFLFQIKFISGANAAGAKPRSGIAKALKAECVEIERRKAGSRWEAPQYYFFMTNAPLTTLIREEIKTQLHESLGNCEVHTMGADDICDLLDGTPYIRSAFPQILGLRDLDYLLSAIVSQEILERSRIAVEEAREIAPVFVPTEAYYRALSALRNHHFVVLTGPPEMGKTTIARMIALAKLSEGWQVFDCSGPQDFFQNNKGAGHRIFLADDAFGSTEYRPELSMPWGAHLSKILRAVSGRCWLVWTSRPAPLHFALQHMHLQGAAEDFPSPGQITVDASKVSRYEKAQILYRHAKITGLSVTAKQMVRAHALSIVSSEFFTPERVRRFVDGRLRDLGGKSLGEVSGDKVKYLIEAEISEPTKRMRQSFENIDLAHRYFMISMLDAGTRSCSIEDCERSYYEIFGEDVDLPPKKIAADLDGHFIRSRPNRAGFLLGTDDTQPARFYEWVHPSWRDIAIGYLASHRKTKSKFLNSCGVNGISLALSVGGGVSGERQAPLISSGDDWAAISRRISHLASEVRQSSAISLLVVVRNSLDRADSLGLEAESESLRATLGEALGALRDFWDKAGVAISPENLMAYYDVSTVLDPLQPSPRLGPTWSYYESSLEKLLDEEYGGEEVKDAAQDLLRLVSVIKENEPRFLRQKILFDEKFEVINCFLNFFEEYDADSGSDLDSVMYELDIVQGASDACFEIANYFPSLEAKSKEVMNVLGLLISGLDDERSSLELKAEAEDWIDEEEWYRERGAAQEGVEHRGSVGQSTGDWLRVPVEMSNVEDIFRDL